jgi:TetR/AcrR family transcriptional regulator, fatty acid metabolism regulator protein
MSDVSKRERILRAAIEVFARTGYFNARVSQVAKEAGVADGTIYLYFSGKEELLLTIFREEMEASLAAARKVLDAIADPREKVREIVRLHLARLGADRSLAVVFQVELRHSLKFMAMFSQHEFAGYLNLVRSTIEEGQQMGHFRSSLHPQLIAKAIFGMIDEMVTSWMLSDKEYDLAAQATELADLVLNGIEG